MARPTKEGLDYFPLDIDVDQDDKLVVPVAKFGMRGFGIIVKLMMEVYRNGYFYSWTEKEVFVFSKRINDDINYVTDVINECIKWGFFSQKLFEEYQILTSSGFQKRYVEASKRRKSITFIDAYTLIDLSEACAKVYHPITEVDVNGNEVNVYINPSSCNGTDTESAQSKKKVNKRESKKKVKEIKTKYAEFVSMTESEYQKLINEYGDVRTKRMIEILDNYKGSKGKTYKSDYRAILNWVVGEEEQRFGHKQPEHLSGGKAPYSTNNSGHQAKGYSQTSSLTPERDVRQDGTNQSSNNIFVRR